jgi:predicted dehydrogenase
VQFPRAQLAAILQDCRKLLQQADWSAAVSLPAPHTPITEFTQSPSAGARRPRAALFGYGNFAKTVVLPNLRETIDVVRIHEVDPIQLGRTPLRGCVSDTSPTIRPDEEWEACFIAGYHHTHAPLAIETLRRGSYAVVEKPTVTTQEQLQALSAELSVRPNKLFECYQRRYTVLNDWARKDLEIGPQTPVDYHAIVYEVPLPLRHWYRWPNSRTRLTSNGCHWIDHFLYLNGYAEPDRLELARGPRGIVNVSITLRNRAFGTMVLTDEGSERTGVQDHVELRANGRTAFIENNCHYRSEGRFGVIRRRRTHKIDSYRRMYRTIARQIVDGAPRDARQALQVSSRTILALEDML